MGLTYFDNYAEIVANMQKVLQNQDEVHTPENYFISEVQAELLAKDLGLELHYAEIEARYYFKKKQLSVQPAKENSLWQNSGGE